MPDLDMKGPFSLNSKSIDNYVGQTQPGNYALGQTKNSIFYVEYVGRSDDDVNARLKQHIAEKYQDFTFSYASSPKDAFEKECQNYHDFDGDKGHLDNKIHPDRPENTNWKCPFCKIFD